MKIVSALLALALAVQPAAARHADQPDTDILFPLRLQKDGANRLVRLETLLAFCPKMKRGPGARKLWRSVAEETRKRGGDVEGVRRWIINEIALERGDAEIPAGGWCETLAIEYGPYGRKQNNGAVNADGSPGHAECFKKGTCLTQDEIWIVQ